MFIDSPTNQQFVVLPNKVAEKLARVAAFEHWGPSGPKESRLRFVTDWTTTDSDINALIDALPYATEYKMTYSEFYKWGISLISASENPDEPLSESGVRRFVMEVVERQEEWGNEPVKDAMWSDVHAGWTSKSLREDMSAEELTDWIMETEEMRQALEMFRGEVASRPERCQRAWVLSEERVEEITVSELLSNLVPMESDWQ